MGQNPQERRSHFRRRLEKQVFCYIDGNRLDAMTSDISLGGLFLSTPEVRDVPMGALVALVFRGGEQAGQTVYLFGKVVRTQDAPDPGVGLKWEKAVTTGSARVLAEFLGQLFGIPRGTIKVEEEPSTRGDPRIVFRFAGLENDVPPPPAPVAPAAPERKSRRGDDWRPRGADPSIDTLDVQVLRNAPADPAPPQAPMPMPRFARTANDATRGAISTQIDARQVRIATNLDATLSFEGLNVPTRLLQVGVASMFAETRVMPVDAAGADVSVAVDVPTPEGRVPVICRCKVMSVDPGTMGVPGLDLAIIDVQEGRNKGIYMRFLKWLHFNNLAR